MATIITKNKTTSGTPSSLAQGELAAEAAFEAAQAGADFDLTEYIRNNFSGHGYTRISKLLYKYAMDAQHGAYIQEQLDFNETETVVTDRNGNIRTVAINDKTLTPYERRQVVSELDRAFETVPYIAVLSQEVRAASGGFEKRASNIKKINDAYTKQYNINQGQNIRANVFSSALTDLKNGVSTNYNSYVKEVAATVDKEGKLIGLAGARHMIQAAIYNNVEATGDTTAWEALKQVPSHTGKPLGEQYRAEFDGYANKVRDARDGYFQDKQRSVKIEYTMDNGAFVSEAINSAEGLSTAAFEERIDATREAAMVYGVSENDLGMEGLVKAQKMHSMSGRALAQSREILRELDKAGKLDTSHELLLNPTLRKEFYEAAEKNEKQRLSSRSFEARKKYTRAIADAANAPVDLDGTVGGDLGLIVAEILRDAELKAEAAARMPGVDYDEAFEAELSKATSEFTKNIQRGSGHRYEKNDSGQFFRFRQQIQTPEKDSPAEAYNNSVARITTAMRANAGKDFQTAVNLAIATFGSESRIKKAVANFDSTGRVPADIQGAALELGYENGVELLRAVAKGRGVEMKTTPTVFERRNTVSPKERRFLDALMADNYFNPRSVVLTSNAPRRPGFEAVAPPPVEAPVAPPSSEGWSRLSKVLRTGEGTLGNEGYTTMFTGTKFTGFEDHPRKLNTSGALTSDAAGAYQFLSTTWDEAKAALNLTDFSPESQELAGRFLVERRGVDPDKPIETKEEFIQVMAKLAPEWASMPIIKDGKSVSYYGGQPAKDIDTLWQIYQEGN
jgi:muramidase (phage lysozyme)